MKLLKWIVGKWISLMLLNTNSRCDKVRLKSFIECTTTKRYSSLKKLRFIPVSKIALQLAWSTLFEEYCIMSKNPGYELFYEQMRKVYRIDAKLLSISSCVRTLAQQYDQDCVNILRSFGYNYRFNYEFQKAYNEDLNRVINKSKTLIIERDREKLMLESKKTISKKESVSTDYFHASLSTLSKYMGFRLDPRQITVAEFCTICVGYEKEIEQLMHKN